MCINHPTMLRSFTALAGLGLAAGGTNAIRLTLVSRPAHHKFNSNPEPSFRPLVNYEAARLGHAVGLYPGTDRDSRNFGCILEYSELSALVRPNGSVDRQRGFMLDTAQRSCFASASVLLMLVCAIGPVASAESTWNNLQFGAALDEVKQALSKLDFKLEQSDKSWIVKPDWGLKMPGVKTDLFFHFMPSLLFSDAGKLEVVNLVLKGIQPDDGAGVGQYFAATWIEQQLIAKYGAPATEAGPCNNARVTDFVSNPRKFDCKAVWKTGEQTVTLSWVYYGKSVGAGELTLEIIYEALKPSAF